MIIQDIAFVVLGLLALFFGGDNLVKGASRIAQSFGVPPLIIGLTIVAFGTSAPELIVNVSAALNGTTSLALGNVVGSNVANIGLIMGISGLIAPITVQAILVRREIPIVIGFSLLTFVLALNGDVSFVDGMILVFSLVVFNVVFLQLALTESSDAEDDAAEDDSEEYSRVMEIGRFIGGMVLLVIGGQLMVEGSTSIARELGVSDLVIGVTLVAFGTSLPELTASVLAAMRKQTDILVGNVIGSNIYNLLAVLGFTALVENIPVSNDVLTLQFPVMILYTFLLLPFALDRVFERWESGAFLAGYIVFIGVTIATL